MLLTCLRAHVLPLLLNFLYTPTQGSTEDISAYSGLPARRHKNMMRERERESEGKKKDVVEE